MSEHTIDTEIENKEHLKEGEIVTTSKLSGPQMVVKELVRKRDEHHRKDYFIGVKCYWFDNHLAYQEATFHAKDLVRI